jgi:parvulin-like peptidyl-prolyl isomerase
MTTLPMTNLVLESSEIIPLLSRHQMIPRLLREMIIDQAIADISCTSAEIAAACEETYRRNRLTTETEQQAWRSRYSFSLADVEQIATRPLKINKFKQINWGSRLTSYFSKRRDKLDTVIFSMLRCDNKGVANELHFRIQDDKTNFAEIARQYSQGSEAELGGLVGPVELGKLAPELAMLLHNSPVGVVHPPVRLGEWIVIARLEKLIPAQLDEAMRSRLLQENFEHWLQTEMEKMVVSIEQNCLNVAPMPA